MSSQPLLVGDELRRAREEAGLELADVAAHLRIRSNFLSALEEGRPDALPGITYAIGYVRTYAAFLGLEPDTAVRRFKEEAAGLNAKTQLVFPSPAPEGRVPGLVLMLVAAMLAGGAYGGWYWVSERDGSLRDLVPAVPDRLAQLIGGDAPTLPRVADNAQPNVGTTGSYADANPTGVTLPRTPGSVPAPPAATPSPGTPSAGTPSTGAPAAVEPAPPRPGTVASAPTVAPSPNAGPPAGAAPGTAAPGTAAPNVAAVDGAAEPAPSAPSIASPGAATSTPADTAQPDAATSETAPTRTEPTGTEPTRTAAAAVDGGTAPANDPATAADDPDVTASPEPAATAPADGSRPAEAGASSADTYADGGDDVPAAPRIASLIGASEAAVPAGRTAAGPVDRVMIRATGDSWVQVRDAQGTALFTRVLREGDVYRVPEQPGLRLATGNAGALQVLVDGNPAPGLGDFGEVVRNVALDPSLLAAGTAIGSSR